ncbi:hypothetical protein EDD17DRAFT_1759472 [Pisolithus thermaeus]|nr:hypothetical protein EV401DRAFT_2081816 [Pisolithus croceorrhizus]KAI6161368.1 hypothetical protein EDD17DRAFT_1759472 [Pisolithus thermaeus]
MAPQKLPTDSSLKSRDAVAQHPTAKPCVQHSSDRLTNENHKEEYLNLFWSKLVTLKNGRKMNQPMALQELCASLITMEDIADKAVDSNAPLDAHMQDTQQTDSEHNEQAVEDAVQDTHEPETHIPDTRDHPPATVPYTVTCTLDTVTHSSDEGIGMDGQDIDNQGAPDTDTGNNLDNGHGECGDVQCGDSKGKFHCVDNYLGLTYISPEGPDSDWSADDRCCHKVEQCHKETLAGNYDIDSHLTTPPHQTPLSSSESDGDNHTTEINGLKSTGLAGYPWKLFEKHRHLSLRSIMITAGLTMKATWMELIWNMHQAWYAGKHSKQSGETTKHYHAHQMQHYEEHKDEHDYLQLWVEIHKFWKESVTSTKDMSLKAMVGRVMTCRDAFTQAAQTWCSVEGIQVFGCIIYSGNDEAACQAQGIFAGSQLCMQLASKRQMDVARLMDYPTMIIK